MPQKKKDHWVIRRYFDTYFTQGPFFTRGFKALAKKYKDFEVVETRLAPPRLDIREPAYF